MRDQYSAFQERDTEILSLGPDGAALFKAYWKKNSLPFPGLPDPRHVVAKVYGQPIRFLKLGRMPMLLIVDSEGVIRHRHDGTSMSDIPSNTDVLAWIDAL